MSEVSLPTYRAVHRLFRLIAWNVLGLSTLMLLGLIGLQLLMPSVGVAALAVGELVAIAGAAATLWLLPRRRLGLAAAPMLTTLFSMIALYALVYPPLTSLATVGLALAMIFVALFGGRRLTGSVAAVTVGTALLIALVAPSLSLAIDVGALAPLLLSVGPAVVIGLLWFAVDGLIVARDEAVALAERRAAEAEQARAEAEQARAQAEARAEEQARLLALVQTLELPVLPVGHGVLAVPLIGSLDSRRLAAIRAAILEAIVRERARTVIFDLTGIDAVDSAVARGLIQTAQAIRLLGARPLLSGVRAPVAQTLAGLEVGLEGFQPVASLSEALAGDDHARADAQ